MRICNPSLNSGLKTGDCFIICFVVFRDQELPATMSMAMRIKKLNTIASLALVMFASAAAAFADNPLPKANENIEKYGQVEGWSVFANKTRRNCYISKVDGSGAIQMGVTRDREVGYLGVFTKKDIGAKDGTLSEVFVNIDGSVYAGIATGIEGNIQGGYSGGYILTDDPKFKRDLAKKYNMVVFPDTQGAFVVDLKGTYKAMAMGRKCLMEQ